MYLLPSGPDKVSVPSALLHSDHSWSGMSQPVKSQLSQTPPLVPAVHLRPLRLWVLKI